MDLLDNVIQEYAWGSRTAIADLMGRPSPAAKPQAELWMGAHPSAPSRVDRGGARRSLLELIEKAPEEELGAASARAFGPKLPFLLKVLAADAPLSLQVHPSLAQAAEGFDAEEARGVPRDAPHRNYKDRNHKPELLCALTPFDALCGFRDARETVALLDALASPALDALAAPLRARPDGDGVGALVTALLRMDPAPRSALTAEVLAACAREAGRGAYTREFEWALKLGERYPGDVGAVTALLLNLVSLAPGEAIYLPAGNLHAYLCGVGVEIMANSDNVLRGGLTPKHVDVPELLRVLEFRAGQVPVVRPRAAPGGEEVYDTPAREFRLSRVRVAAGGAPFRATPRGPEVLLCTAGRATARAAGGSTVELSKGASAFVRAADGAYEIAGDSEVFRATLGEG